jgi:tetratricopeptide (TPR) repeat protein
VETENKPKTRWVLKAELAALACIFCIWVVANTTLGTGTLTAAVFEKTARMNPDDADAQYNLGEAYWRLADYEKAAQAYKDTIRINPDNFDARYSLALAYEHLGRHQEALEVCKEAIIIDPVNAAAYFGLDSQAAFMVRDRCLPASPQMSSHSAIGPKMGTDIFPSQAENSNTQNQLLDIQVLERNAQVEGSAEVHCKLGHACVRANRYEQAARAFVRATQVDPNDATAYLSLGVTRDRLGRYAEAIDAYEQAVRLRPDDPLGHRNLGLAYARLDRHAEAMDAYKQAVSINPDYAEAHYLLGLNHLIQCDKASALREYEILKSLAPYLADKLHDTFSQ